MDIPDMILQAILFLERNMTPSDPPMLEAARLLTFRLARLSVDSHWARRSSGLRGSLLKEVEQMENLQEMGLTLREDDLAHLGELVGRGFEIIVAAAREIRTMDDLDDLQLDHIRRLLNRP
jgi:hypothetical protein